MPNGCTVTRCYKATAIADVDAFCGQGHDRKGQRVLENLLLSRLLSERHRSLLSMNVSQFNADNTRFP